MINDSSAYGIASRNHELLRQKKKGKNAIKFFSTDGTFVEVGIDRIIACPNKIMREDHYPSGGGCSC